MLSRLLSSSLFIAALLLVACSARAQDEYACTPGSYTVAVETPEGRQLQTFYHRGQSYVLGSFGDRYNIRVSNPSACRVEAVITVDGRDVVSGRMGDFVRERGYLIAPYSSVVVEGFRQSTDAVAAFRFTNPGNSYSSRMGTPQNVGVIGVAFFPERQYRRRPVTVIPRGPVYYGQGRNRGGMGAAADEGSASSGASRRPATPSAEAAPSATGGDSYVQREENRNNLGTEYGESQYSPVREVNFVRGNPSRPARTLALRYDDRNGLIARGIQVDPPVYYSYPVYQSEPNPFPRNNRFAPPPPY